jgi:hypothetical protein
MLATRCRGPQTGPASDLPAKTKARGSLRGLCAKQFFRRSIRCFRRGEAVDDNVFGIVDGDSDLVKFEARSRLRRRLGNQGDEGALFVGAHRYCARRRHRHRRRRRPKLLDAPIENLDGDGARCRPIEIDDDDVGVEGVVARSMAPVLKVVCGMMISCMVRVRDLVCPTRACLPSITKARESLCQAVHR